MQREVVEILSSDSDDTDTDDELQAQLRVPVAEREAAAAAARNRVAEAELEVAIARAAEAKAKSEAAAVRARHTETKREVASAGAGAAVPPLSRLASPPPRRAEVTAAVPARPVLHTHSSGDSKREQSKIDTVSMNRIIQTVRASGARPAEAVLGQMTESQQRLFWQAEREWAEGLLDRNALPFGASTAAAATAPRALTLPPPAPRSLAELKMSSSRPASAAAATPVRAAAAAAAEPPRSSAAAAPAVAATSVPASSAAAAAADPDGDDVNAEGDDSDDDDEADDEGNLKNFVVYDLEVPEDEAGDAAAVRATAPDPSRAAAAAPPIGRQRRRTGPSSDDIDAVRFEEILRSIRLTGTWRPARFWEPYALTKAQNDAISDATKEYSSATTAEEDKASKAARAPAAAAPAPPAKAATAAAPPAAAAAAAGAPAVVRGAKRRIVPEKVAEGAELKTWAERNEEEKKIRRRTNMRQFFEMMTGPMVDGIADGMQQYGAATVEQFLKLKHKDVQRWIKEATDEDTSRAVFDYAVGMARAGQYITELYERAAAIPRGPMWVSAISDLVAMHTGLPPPSVADAREIQQRVQKGDLPLSANLEDEKITDADVKRYREAEVFLGVLQGLVESMRGPRKSRRPRKRPAAAAPGSGDGEVSAASRVAAAAEEAVTPPLPAAAAQPRPVAAAAAGGDGDGKEEVSAASRAAAAAEEGSPLPTAAARKRGRSPAVDSTHATEKKARSVDAGSPAAAPAASSAARPAAVRIPEFMRFVKKWDMALRRASPSDENLDLLDKVMEVTKSCMTGKVTFDDIQMRELKRASRKRPKPLESLVAMPSRSFLSVVLLDCMCSAMAARNMELNKGIDWQAPYMARMTALYGMTTLRIHDMTDPRGKYLRQSVQETQQYDMALCLTTYDMDTVRAKTDTIKFLVDAMQMLHVVLEDYVMNSFMEREETPGVLLRARAFGWLWNEIDKGLVAPSEVKHTRPEPERSRKVKDVMAAVGDTSADAETGYRILVIAGRLVQKAPGVYGEQLRAHVRATRNAYVSVSPAARKDMLVSMFAHEAIYRFDTATAPLPSYDDMSPPAVQLRAIRDVHRTTKERIMEVVPGSQEDRRGRESPYRGFMGFIYDTMDTWNLKADWCFLQAKAKVGEYAHATKHNTHALERRAARLRTMLHEFVLQYSLIVHKMPFELLVSEYDS